MKPWSASRLREGEPGTAVRHSRDVSRKICALGAKIITKQNGPTP
jgi:hypothetical protein